MILFLAAAARAEVLSFGVRAGLPIGEGLQTIKAQNVTIQGHQRFLFGPTVELSLPAGVGVSLDALYRRYSTEANGSNGKGGGQWEFPVMLRYKFPGILFRPFIGAGPMFYKVTGLPTLGDTKGFAMGGGVVIKAPIVKISPEIRYQRRFDSKLIGTLQQNQNQLDLIVGFTF